jgi:hypothetical protein
MQWLKAIFGRQDDDRPQADREAFQRRERSLQDRLRRLERMAIEADVIQRNDTPEWQAK